MFCYKLFRVGSRSFITGSKVAFLSCNLPHPPPPRLHVGLGLGVWERRNRGVSAAAEGKAGLASRNSEGGQGERRCSYLHEQFDLGLFFSHGCVGDQEAAVAGGTGRGPGLGRRVSQSGILFSRPRAVCSAQHQPDQTRWLQTRSRHRTGAPHT